MNEVSPRLLNPLNQFLKRGFDLLSALVGILLVGWLLPLLILLARISCSDTGLFRQSRIGLNGQLFTVYKLRTMCQIHGMTTTVTTSNDLRITSLGKFLRKTKLDELPQLLNIIKGDMSFVGPRPDVPGYADQLRGENRLLLKIRPGITGPATLKFRDEESLLAQSDDPEKYNREVIWPEKVRLNLEYIKNYRFRHDIYYILATVFHFTPKECE